MNCQQVSEWLNDRDVARLGVSERNRVESHLASCPDCAADWALHQRLLRLPLPAMPERLARWTPESGSAGIGTPRRKARGPMIVGVVLLAGAAAAMVTGWHAIRSTAGDGGEPDTMQPVRNEAMTDASASDLEVSSGAQTEPQDASDRGETSPASNPYAFTVAIRLHADAADSAASRSAYEALLDELGSIPNLILIEHETAEPWIDSDGDLMIPFPPAVDILMQAQGDDSDRERFSVRWVTARGSGVWARAGSTPREKAAGLVDVLRQLLFPPPDRDLTWLADIQARALNPDLAQDMRIDAIRDLQRLAGSFAILDEAVQDEARSGIALAAIQIASSSSDAEVRYGVWQLVGDWDSAYVVPAMSDALLAEPVDYVRLEIARLLGTRVADDASVRAVLDYAVANDPSPALRLVARWSLLDDAGRRALLEETLSDTSRPDSERLEIALSEIRGYERYIRGLAAGIIVGLAARLDNDATRELLIRDLGRAEDPAVLDQLLATLESDTDEQVRRVAALALKLGFAEEPRVGPALERARDGDPSAIVRDAL